MEFFFAESKTEDIPTGLILVFSGKKYSLSGFFE